MLGTQLLLLLSGSVSRQSNQAVGEKALPSLRASSIMQKFLGREDWKDTQALGGFVYQLPGLCESGALAQGHHAQWPRLHTAQLHRSIQVVPLRPSILLVAPFHLTSHIYPDSALTSSKPL